MSFEYNCRILPYVNINQVYSMVKIHVLVSPPPWSLDELLQSIRTPNGRPICLVVDYRSREVSLVPATDQSAGRQVLQTTVQAFQKHRLSAPVVNPLFERARRQGAAILVARSIGQACTICFEDICTSNVRTLPCAHSYHQHCIGRWLTQHNTCPVCRSLLSD